MDMVRIPEAELQKGFRALADRARREPVAITTDDGRDKLVVLSAEEYAPPCCRDRRYGRTEPDPCSGLCDADVLRASQLQHSVQHANRDGHLARLSPVRSQTEPIADDALPARDVSLHQGAPVVP